MSLSKRIAKKKLRLGISKLNEQQKLDFLSLSLETLNDKQLTRMENYFYSYPDSKEKTIILNKIKELRK